VATDQDMFATSRALKSLMGCCSTCKNQRCHQTWLGKSPGFLQVFMGKSSVINGNFRILKWRYHTIYLTIFCGDIPLDRPKTSALYMVGTSNQSVPEMDVDSKTTPNRSKIRAPRLPCPDLRPSWNWPT
jgi:hypothetical protein